MLIAQYAGMTEKYFSRNMQSTSKKVFILVNKMPSFTVTQGAEACKKDGKFFILN